MSATAIGRLVAAASGTATLNRPASRSALCEGPSGTGARPSGIDPEVGAAARQDETLTQIYSLIAVSVPNVYMLYKHRQGATTRLVQVRGSELPSGIGKVWAVEAGCKKAREYCCP